MPFGINVTWSEGVAIDGHWDIGVYSSGGGGGGVGAGTSGGLSIQGSNGETINDLKGPFTNVSAGGGWGATATGDGFVGQTRDGRTIIGGGVTIGAGLGETSFAGITDTKITPITNPNPSSSPCQ